MRYIKVLSVTAVVVICIMQACTKEKKQVAPVDTGGAGTTGGTDGSTVILPQTDAALAATQGFFMDAWQTKTFTAPTAAVSAAKPAAGSIFANVDYSKVISKVSKYMFGNNTNPYMGQYVTEPVLMNNITSLSPNILRFPGGSLSDIYFWDGVTPADAPAELLDATGKSSPAGYWYGNKTDSWTFSLDNYYKVLQQTNSTGIITVNYGYARYGTGTNPAAAAAHLAAQWVRYDKGRTKYWEIGNENYGSWEAGNRINTVANKDGQPERVTGAVYGTHFKIYADSMRKAAAEVGNTGIKIGIVLTEDDERKNTSVITQNWNAGALAQAGNSPDFFVVHNYYTPSGQNSTADVILATPASVTPNMVSWVKTSASNAGVTLKPIALDEWNIFATGSKQMVSNVAGVHAALTLGETIKNQFGMACRWDLANGWESGNDHGLFNTGDEPGAAKWNARPAFYYLYFFQKYFGDRMVSSTVTGSADIMSYASSFTSGQAGTVLVNKGSADHAVTVKLSNFAAGTKYYYYTLNGGTDNGTFSQKVFVNGTGPAGASGGPANYSTMAASSADIAGGITVNVPARGAVFLIADGK
ncbi:alpha-L-arabinofuranosidase [Mucilaginibacter sp. ZT4R22]|uniref:Alpha-L-arabinofuranosidase n=1 Tax=Mucilaginibacter pankratovii TaxID=2772110 RepID=A0ABR7WNM8_9SPHI|nr:alpha-L-arabinofuranosidase [Mucilaginibacter pankratovii]MBD1363097.1 alpha-L-arabinofuranosidase [Mucilaginibacter pankratovii]